MYNLPGFTLPLWTSACFPAALTSNPPRFLAPFGLLPCLPQLQRPIRHAFLLLLDFYHASRSFNVQYTTVSCSFWTSTCLPQLQRPIHHGFLLLLDFCHASRSFNVQSVTLSCSFWTSTCLPQLQRPIYHAFLLLLDFHMPPTALTSNPSRFLAPFGPQPASPQLQRPIHHGFLLLLDFHMPPAALTSNPPRFLAPFGLLPCLPQLQRPIRHAFLLLLDFCHASHSFNVQSVTLSCSFWTSACFPTALTSNLTRFLAPFGPQPVSPQLQRPIRHAFLLLLDFCLLPRSFNVQSVTLSCSFWTSACFPAASTSNPSRFLAPFGLLPAFPPLQRLIRHASKPHLPPHNHKLLTTQKSNTSTSVPALLYIF